MTFRIMFPSLLILTLFCTSSDEGDPTALLSLEHNRISMHPGDSWLYVQKNISRFEAYPDSVNSSVAGYAYYSVSRDTSIDGRNAVIIEGTRYSIDTDSIYTGTQQWAACFGDTILMYAFKTDDGESVPRILKCRSGQAIEDVSISRRTTDMASDEFNTDIFNDLVYPIIFPLEQGSAFFYRLPDGSEENFSVSRKFRGTEMVTVPAGTFAAYRFEFLIGSDRQGYDEWIGEHGLLKRSVTYKTTSQSPDGSVIVSGTFEDITELVGTKNIDPDTLVPWNKR